MGERGLRWIEDDIAGSWLEDWAAIGVAEIEEFLAKHADFERYLAQNRASIDGEPVDAREVPGEATQPAAE